MSHFVRSGSARVRQDRIPVGGTNQGGELKSRDELNQEIEVLRDRITNLSAACLQVSASLDLTTVLREVVDNARTLTGARYGVIVTVDVAGKVQDFVTSGLTPEKHRQMTDWADGPRLFQHFRDLEEPLRLPDLAPYVRSLGLRPDLMWPKTFQGTPMRHRGVNVGNFFLAEKAGGGEFTGEDEEVLVMFAAQAAAAIANARTYRDERRARADLEALIDTSPVGVVVFDGGTGKLVSVSREARRIVEGLSKPKQSLEELLTVVTCRRGDGREVNLAEFPIAQQLSKAETVRSEQIVLKVPDGRSVTVLVNATPICSSQGAVESVVVTMQDLAPLEEIERSRAEFLSLVSHELRAPLMSIKGSTATVLSANPAPDAAEIQQFFRIIDEQADHMRGLINDLLDAGRIEAGTLSVSSEPSEVAGLVDQARNTFLSGGGRHTVLIDLPPDLPPVLADRSRIVQVLNNLFSNASRHSPESFPIRVAAEREGLHVSISVSDEGRGVSPERLSHLFEKQTRPGSKEGTRGSGLGLAICKGLVEAHGGRIRAESGGVGLGTRITFTIPSAEEGSVAGIAGSLPDSPRGKRKDTRILVVDDDPQMLRYVREALLSAGYLPAVTGDPREVPNLIKTAKPRLVLLDLMLPETDGIELMEHVPEMADLPVIFISGYGRDETIAKALDMGAADYIVKPFSPTELTARVRAALRKQDAPPEPFRMGDLAINYRDREVTVSGKPVELTPIAYDLLRVLSLNAGRITTYESLMRQVWRGKEHASPRLVRTFVKNLRRKLGDNPNDPTYIINVRGVGYRMPQSSGDL